MTHKLENMRAAILAARELNRDAPDGVQYRARRYTDSDTRGFMRVTWGVVKLERVPDSLRRVWPDGFRPMGFHWFA